MRPLALSEALLVAAPQLLANAPPPAVPSDLAALPTLGLGNSPDEQRWRLRSPRGEWVEHHHRPRLVVDDVGTLLDAALAGTGCTLLPRLMVYEYLQRGALQVLLPEWSAPPGVVQVAYASRQGMRAAVRQLIDALAAGFARLIEERRCLSAPHSA